MSFPFRIGIVLHDFALGGTERIATRLANAWAARGAAVTIVCGADGGPIRALLEPGIEVIAADPPIPRAAGSRRRLAQAAAAILAGRPVDIVFLPGNFHWPVAPALSRLPNPPAIVAQVSAALSKPQRGRWKQHLFEARMRWLLRDVAALVTMAQVAERKVRAILPRKGVTTIALPALADDERPPTAPPAAPRIVAVGRLVPEKGFDTLIEAVARLDGVELAIIGEGPDRARLEELIATHDLGNRVVLPGYSADPRPWLDRARIAAMPSRFEGYSAALVEALAAGRPVVSTDCTPANGELIDGESGRVVPIDDAAALAAALADLLAAPTPSLEHLAARVARFRIGPVADAYLDLFARVAAARR